MLLVVTGLYVVPVAASAAPCDEPVQNPVLCENTKTGDSGWLVNSPSNDIEGFATDISVNKGETVGFKVDTDASDYRIDIYRLGYYQGLGGRLIDSVTPSASLPQSQPACLTQASTGLIDCGNWGESASWDVPVDAVSGVYVAKLVTTDGSAQQNDIVFVVRDDASSSDLLFQTSDTTWQAYNNWGGNSLYEGQPAGRAYKVSYNRPFTTSYEDWLYSAEYPMIRFLEANGYDVSYTTGVDSHRRGGLITNHGTFVSVGHDEYWSGQQRDNVEAARDAGVNLAFFSGNEVFWKTRWEDSIDGSGTPMRTLVTYKETNHDTPIDPAFDDGVWTGTWRDARFSPPADGGRPENALTGTIFTVNGAASRADAIQVPAADGKMRFWRNTSVADLAPGQTASLPNGTLGYEWDEALDNGHRPPGLVHLSTATYEINGDYLIDDGVSYGDGTATHHLTQYRADSGALVFGAGTIQWSWGLDQDWGVAADQRMRQATVNLLADMGAQPDSLAGGLVTAQPSSDSTAPTSTIDSPSSGSALPPGQEVTLVGTATDAGGGVVGSVEVSLDGGSTWRPADGREDWSYTFTPTDEGPLTVLTRAADDSSNLESPGAGSSYTVGDGPADVTAPVVTETLPVDGATGVPVGASLSATFDEDVQADSVSWSVSGPAGAVAGSSGYAGGSRTASFQPDAAWAPETTYSVTVDGARDPSGNTMDPVTWTFTTADVDVTPPAVTGYSPADSTTDVSVDIAVSATFDEDMSSSSVGVTLEGPGGSVPGAVDYDSASRTATFVPTDDLDVGTAYTATVTGEDLAGNVLEPVSWSFTTVDVVPVSASIFGDEVPSGGADPDTGSVELGVKFVVDEPGFVTGVRFYKGTANTGTHVGNLWDSSGVLLASATFVDESGSGWQQVEFASPVAVEPGQTYVVSYFAPNGRYHATSGFFDGSGAGSAPIRALADGVDGGNGVYAYGASSAFPTGTWNSSNYWVDALFTNVAPDATGPEVVSTTPAADATDVAVDTTISATFSESIQEPAGFTLVRASDQASVVVTASYDDPARTATLTPAAPLDSGTEYTATVTDATDLAGNALVDPVQWSFTTAAADTEVPSVSGVLPAIDAVDVPVDVTVEVSFTEDVVQSSIDAVMRGPGGDVAAAVTYEPSTRTAFVNPTSALEHETTYTVEVTGVQDAAGNAMDPYSWSFTTVAPDVQPPVVVLTSPADTAVDVAADTVLAVTFDEDVIPGTVGWALDGPAGTVTGTSGYDSASRTASFTPDGDLASGTAYTVTLSGVSDTSGNPMNTYSWSFTTADVEPPQVVATDPADGATGIAVDTTVTVAFDEVVDESTLVVLLSGPNGALSGATTYTASGSAAEGTLVSEASFVPTAPLESSADYTVAVQASDLAGNAMAEVSWSFTAADVIPPAVVSTTPTDGATGVPVTTTIAASFDEPLVETEVALVLTGPSGAVTGTQSYDADARTVTFVADTALGFDEDYAVDLGGAADAAGNVAEPVSWTFRTAAAPDTTAPAVSSTTPSDGATKVSVAVTLSATFDEDIDPATVAWDVTGPAGAVAGGTSYDVASRTASFQPEEPLASAGEYTVTLTGAQDLSGNAMTAVNWGFVTADVLPPTIVDQSPTADATDVAVSAVISATFDEDLLPGAVSIAVAQGPDPVVGTTSYDDATRTVTFQPDADLASSAPYTVTVQAEDQSGNLMDPTSWSFTTADVVAPTVVDTLPAQDAADVGLDTAVQVSFSEPMTEPVSLTLVRAADGASVVATVSYDAASATATLEPSAPLDAATEYTATVAGQDVAGNALEPVSWSFTTVDVAPVPVSIFGDETPSGGADPDTVPVELGVKFVVDEPGFVTGVRFYKGTANTGTHVGNLWDSAGVLLASATFVDESGSGWQQVEFASPVAVEPGQTYVVSYFAPNGRYHATNRYFASSGAGSAPIRALADGVDGGNGVYAYGSPSTFPTGSWNAANYWVDALFVADSGPDSTPPVVTGTTPADGALDVAPEVVLRATFSEPVAAGTISWGVAGPSGDVSGSTGYDTATRTASFVPDAPLDLDSTYTVDLAGATDLAGNVLTATNWSFTTSDSTSGCPCSVWSDADAPAGGADPDDSAIEVGVKLTSSIDGYITGLRFYKHAENTGTHVGHLWHEDGTLLSAATFTNETAAGWQQVLLPRPVPVSAGSVYVASYVAPEGRYASSPGFLDEETVSGPLTLRASGDVGGNGVYAYGTGGEMPRNTYQNEYYWVDVVFDTSDEDVVPPGPLALAPAAGATDAPVGTSVSVTFDEPVQQPVTMTLTRAADGASVGADVTYYADTNTATLLPWAQLEGLTEYTVSVSGVVDEAGNAGDPVEWSFTTWDPTQFVDPTAGPNDGASSGPLLVVTSGGTPYSDYLVEILRAEGLNHFATLDVALLSPERITGFDSVVLGEAPLTPGQATTLSDYVAAGGNLVAMRPDAQLADLFGVTPTGGTLDSAYLQVQTGSEPGAGITPESVQFKGEADLYTLSGADSVAELYSSASQSTGNPAVTLTSVGTAGGAAGMFAYDLARSVALQRQGNPAWAGQERDGQAPIRSDDQFYGGVTDPDWVDLSKVAIPQADEQQRLLANMLTAMSADDAPLPRFFYFPHFTKAVVVGTGDDHALGGTAGRFDTYLANSPVGCDDSKWECPRFTSYIYPGGPLSSTAAEDYEAAGFEVATHVTTYCLDYDKGSLDATFTNDLAAFATAYPGVSAPRTNRTHCLVWSDWAGTPEVSLDHGVRLDTNYYYWPGDWLQDRPGFMTGSGMPMRFVDTAGDLIDVYQAPTQMTDESGQSYPYTPEALLDAALGPQGYYGAFVTNHHTDTASVYEDDQTLAAALARGVPVITAARLLDWTDGRNASSFDDVTWNGGELAFSITQATGADGITAMLPTSTATQQLAGVTRSGQPVQHTVETVKGVEYAVFEGLAGDYLATYADTASATTQQASYSTTREVATRTAAADGSVISDVHTRTTAAGEVVVTWTTSQAVASEVRYGTDPFSQQATAREDAPRREHELVLTDLTPGGTYYFTVVAGVGSAEVTWPAVGEPPRTFEPTRSTAADLAVAGVHVSPLPGTGVVLSWDLSRAATATVQYGQSPTALDRTARTSEPAREGQVVVTDLEPDTTYYYRLTVADSAGSRATFPRVGRMPERFVAPVAGVGTSTAVSFRRGDTVGVDVTAHQDGELTLAGVLSADFDAATRLPGAVAREEPGGTAEQQRGTLVLDGTRWQARQVLRSNRTLQAAVQFAGQGRQAVGVERGDGGGFVGVVNRAGTLSLGQRSEGTWEYTRLPGGLATALDRPVELDLTRRSGQLVLSVDGRQIATVPLARGAVRPTALDMAEGDGALEVSWLRAGSGRTKGTFTSPVLDALQVVTWDRAHWDADEPTGTRATVLVRTGPTAEPDDSWSSWVAIPRSGATLAQRVEDSRYLQYRVRLSTDDPAVTPTLRHIGFTHNGTVELHGEVGHGQDSGHGHPAMRGGHAGQSWGRPDPAMRAKAHELLDGTSSAAVAGGQPPAAHSSWGWAGSTPRP